MLGGLASNVSCPAIAGDVGFAVALLDCMLEVGLEVFIEIGSPLHRAALEG